MTTHESMKAIFRARSIWHRNGILPESQERDAVIAEVVKRVPGWSVEDVGFSVFMQKADEILLDYALSCLGWDDEWENT